MDDIKRQSWFEENFKKLYVFILFLFIFFWIFYLAFSSYQR